MSLTDSQEGMILRVEEIDDPCCDFCLMLNAQNGEKVLRHAVPIDRDVPPQLGILQAANAIMQWVLVMWDDSTAPEAVDEKGIIP